MTHAKSEIAGLVESYKNLSATELKYLIKDIDLKKDVKEALLAGINEYREKNAKEKVEVAF